jgi:putative hydrolase of HD superfamily
MDFLEKLYVPYKLKDVDRSGLVRDRHESVAEHTYSSLVIARYFLKKHPRLDRERVLKMILYHDFGEIITGDTFILDGEGRKTKLEREDLAVKKLGARLPKEIRDDLQAAWKEYMAGKTMEAKFCLAIDALDPIINVMHRPGEWKKYGFTEKKLRETKQHYFEDFPVLMRFFNRMVGSLKKKKVIPKD